MSETLLKGSQDAGTWIDSLSIFNIKINVSKDSITRERNKANFTRLAKEIQEQIGENKLQEILVSEEYQNLYEINLHIFTLVDKVKSDTGLAKEVDASNIERYLKKAELQKKFFETDLTEVKIGYSTPNER